MDVCPGGEGGGAEGIRRILLNFVYKNIPLYRVMLCFWYCSNFKLCFQDLSLLHLTLLGGWGEGKGEREEEETGFYVVIVCLYASEDVLLYVLEHIHTPHTQKRN